MAAPSSAKRQPLPEPTASPLGIEQNVAKGGRCRGLHLQHDSPTGRAICGTEVGEPIPVAGVASEDVLDALPDVGIDDGFVLAVGVTLRLN